MTVMFGKAVFFMLRWVPAFVMMGLIFTASSLPASEIPFFGAFDVIYKKSGHAIGYALLGTAYYFALPRRLSWGYRAVVALIMVILFALSDEFHQSFVDGRTSSMRDVAIDTAGAALALLAVRLFYSSNSDSNSTS